MPAAMDLLLCWLVAPASLLLATIGLSLLVERLSGLVLPWTVRPALGIAAAIVLAQFGTATEVTARLTLPAILLLALLGFLLGRNLLGRAPDRWQVGVAVVVFLLYASPFLILGQATIAGYIKLEDTATWLTLADHVFEFGRGLGDLAPSTHQTVLADNLGTGYPIGGFVPVALMAWISGQDVAFTIQPSMAFAAVAMALLIFELARRLVAGASLAVAVAILASLSALLVGYYFWGGVKELIVAALLPLPPIIAGCAAGSGWPRRAWLPLGLTIGAVMVVLGAGGAVWMVPTLVPAAVVLWRSRGAARTLALAWPLVVFSLLLVLPVVFTPEGVFDPLSGGLTGEDELGNLAGPLNFFQLAGVWPSLDFRFDPHLKPAVIGLAAICLAAAAVTTVVASRLGERDGVPLVGYVAGGALGAFAIAHFGSPWVDAKVMATLSPALLAAALIGIVMLGQRTGFRLEAVVLGTLISAAVAWSAFLAYQGVWFVPRSHLSELEKIGERFAGEGPALDTEVAIYGPRHFLRKLDAEGASDRRTRFINLAGGRTPGDGEYIDLDQIVTSEFDPYALIIVRRSPGASRPPAFFELAYRTDHYEVWRRRPSPGPLVEHLPLGNFLDPGAVPACLELQRLAREAGVGGKLVAARVGTPLPIELDAASLPPGWSLSSAYAFIPSGSGRFSQEFSLPEAGIYEVWAGGSVFGGVTLRIDGEEVASERALIDNPGAYEPSGPTQLAAGNHTLEVDYEGASLSPGSASQPWAIGPFVLERLGAGERGMVAVPASEYGRLCGRRWDWVEAYSG